MKKQTQWKWLLRQCAGMVVVALLIAGCAGNIGTVQRSGDGTMIDVRTGLMWQEARSKEKFTSGAEADAYAEKLELAGFDDWRLPSSQEIWDLYFTNDFGMGGELARQVTMEGSYWTRDGDKILAGYLEESDDPGNTRYFFDSDKGYVRAVRAME